MYHHIIVAFDILKSFAENWVLNGQLGLTKLTCKNNLIKHMIFYLLGTEFKDNITEWRSICSFFFFGGKKLVYSECWHCGRIVDSSPKANPSCALYTKHIISTQSDYKNWTKTQTNRLDVLYCLLLYLNYSVLYVNDTRCFEMLFVKKKIQREL